MIIALHIQLVHTFAEQMPSNTLFSLMPFENLQSRNANSEILCLNLVDLLVT